MRIYGDKFCGIFLPSGIWQGERRLKFVFVDPLTWLQKKKGEGVRV